jgi:hypothetical protein
MLMAQDVQAYNHDGVAVFELGSPQGHAASLTLDLNAPTETDLVPALTARGIEILPTYDVAKARTAYLGGE